MYTHLLLEKSSKDTESLSKTKTNLRERKMGAVKKLIFEPQYPATWNEEVIRLFEEFVVMRKTVGKPLKTERGVRARIKTLEELSGADVGLKMAILNQTLDNEWQDFYPLKQTNHAPDRAAEQRAAFVRTFEGRF
jgi:hypothetical protein